MPETFIRKQRIRSGKTERLKELVDAYLTEAADDTEGVHEIWDSESLQTLSLFIEHGYEVNYLVRYMEAEDMETLIGARDASTHRLHDLEDELMAETLETPETVRHFEPLAHGVNPNRSQEFFLG